MRILPLHSRRIAGVALLLALAACAGAGSPSSDVSTGEAILQLGDEVSELRQQNADMQTQIDSLRAALARQDSVIRQLSTQGR